MKHCFQQTTIFLHKKWILFHLFIDFLLERDFDIEVEHDENLNIITSSICNASFY